MARNRSTDAAGRPFSAPAVQAVWEKGRFMPGRDQNEWRYDACGNAIQRSQYGDTSSKYGWEIDHIKPASKGGSDELTNLQPLQWSLNRDKGDMDPWQCP
jgi:5-methylcytosine-specific restriction endonuclease McrA